jgi:hypothetical protein
MCWWLAGVGGCLSSVFAVFVDGWMAAGACHMSHVAKYNSRLNRNGRFKIAVCFVTVALK